MSEGHYTLCSKGVGPVEDCHICEAIYAAEAEREMRREGLIPADPDPMTAGAIE